MEISVEYNPETGEYFVSRGEDLIISGLNQTEAEYIRVLSQKRREQVVYGIRLGRKDVKNG